MKKLCTAFKDLYPSYLDDMVEEDTKKWMENHLTQCEQCLQWAEKYKEDSSINKGNYDVMQNSEVYKEDKKVVRRVRIILAIGMSAVLLLAIWTSIWIFM